MRERTRTILTAVGLVLTGMLLMFAWQQVVGYYQFQINVQNILRSHEVDIARIYQLANQARPSQTVATAPATAPTPEATAPAQTPAPAPAKPAEPPKKP